MSRSVNDGSGYVARLLNTNPVLRGKHSKRATSDSSPPAPAPRSPTTELAWPRGQKPTAVIFRRADSRKVGR